MEEKNITENFVITSQNEQDVLSNEENRTSTPWPFLGCDLLL